MKAQEIALRELPLGHRKNVSLTVPPGEGRDVIFANWSVGCAGSLGRAVHVSEGDRLLYPNVPTNPPRDFTGCQIVHPAVGCVIQKTNVKEFRANVPRGIMILQHMWQVALDGIDQRESLAFVDCWVCGSGEGDLRRCAMCLLVSHRECAASAATVVGSASVSALDERCVVPAQWLAIPEVLCRACQEHAVSIP